MSDQPTILVTVDPQAGAAYIELSGEPVARTVEHDPAINIDLDAMGVVVGIEILAEGVALPFDQLVTEYHVHSDVVDLLRMLRPTGKARLDVSTGNDGQTPARSVRTLTAV